MNYDEYFKRRIAKEALEVGNNTAVAKKNGLSESSIRNWIKKYYKEEACNKSEQV